MNWKRRLWKWSAGVFAALVILLAALAGLFRLLTPLVPGYRAQVEQWASTALQHPVEIHAMTAEWGWHGPEMALEDVRILSRDRQRVVVAAQEIRLGLALKSLLHGQLPRPDRVVLVAPRVEVEREADGSYDVRGLEGAAQKNNTDWRRSLEEIFSQRAEVAVKNGQLTLFDARAGGPVVFQHLNLGIDNSADDHRLQGNLQLPAEFGHGLRFEADIKGQGIEPSLWDWHAELHGTGLQLKRWLSYGSAQAQDSFASGNLDLDASADARQGALQHADLDLTGRDLKRTGALGPALGLLQGKFGWQRKDAGWRLEARKLHLQYGASSWPVSALDLEYASGADGERWAGDAGFLRLQDLTALAQWMPAALGSSTDDALRRLHAYSPSGDVSDLAFKARWDGKALQDWSVKAGFQDLGVRAAEGWPGFSGMDGDADLAVSGGQLRLEARNANVDFRPLFRTEMHADSADMMVAVTHDASGWRVAADSFKVANADAAAHGRIAMGFPADGSAPTLDIHAEVDRAEARNKSTYFPVGIMPKEVVKWLDDSIKGGQVTSGIVDIHGKTSDFPYRDDQGGTFDIRFHIQHGELDYMPGWPAVKDYSADVRFLDQGLEAKVLGGTYNGLTLTGGTARFKELASGVLEIDGTARGDASHGLDFLRTGPLKETLADYLDGLSAKGDTDAAVHVYLPLTALELYQLQGNVTLHQVSIGFTDIPALTAEHLEGDLDFGKYGFATKDVHGTALGGPLRFAIRTPHTDHGSASALTAHGTATAAGLAALIGHGSERWLTGDTPWQMDGKLPLQAGLGTAGLNLTLRSDLTGLAIGLPAPFSKAVTEPQPFKLNMKFDEVDDFDYIASYGNELGLLLALTPKGGGSLSFDRGELRVGAGTAARPAAPGLEVSGYLPSFVWDEWKQVLPVSSGETEVAPATARGYGMPDILRNVDLDVGHVAAFGQSVDQMHLAVQRNDEGWQGHIESQPLAGKFNVPAAVDAAHPIVLDMDRADFGNPAAPAVSAAKDAAKQAKTTPAEVHYDPRSIPALRFSSKRLRYGGMVLDNVTLALVPKADGVALEDLKVAAPTFNITGDGTWTVTPAGQQRTALNADVESTDVEKSLQALGYDPGITGDHGSIVASLNWQDSPMGDVTRTLAGSIHVKLDDGQLKEVQPGAGRVFGLLSLNALPRRILLNFSDVFAKGFGYDSIEGDFTVQDGDAYTQNLQMKGPAASIHLVGRIGLAKRDFDEALIVDASVGSTLPVVGALAAGVGVGAVVFLLTEIFKKPLTKAGEVRYHLTGSWDDPKLDKLPDAVPAAATRKKP